MITPDDHGARSAPTHHARATRRSPTPTGHTAGTEMTLPGILAYSSNVGTITIADQLGAQKLYEYQQRFGLGEPTGEGLPGEAAGLVQPPDELERRRRTARSRSGTSVDGHPAADGGRVRARSPTTASTCSRTWSRRSIAPDGTVTPTPAAGDPPGAQRRERRRAAHDAGGGRRPSTGATGALGRGPRLPGRRQDRHRQAAGRRPVREPARSASFIGMAPADEPAVRDRGLRAHPRRQRRRRRRPGVQRHDGSSRCATTGCRRRAPKPPKFAIYPR